MLKSNVRSLISQHLEVHVCIFKQFDYYFYLKFILKQKPASMINLHVTLTFMIDKIWKKNDFCKWKDFSSKEYTCTGRQNFDFAPTN